MTLSPALDGLLSMTPFASLCPSWPDRESCMHATPMPSVTSVLCAPSKCLNASTGRLVWKPAQNGGCAVKCLGRKTSRQTVRWSVLSIPLPNSPGVAVSVDYFGPLAITARGNSYILLFTDRFSRRADVFAVTTAEFTGEGTANILVNRFIPLWGCPSTLLSDNGPQLCARLATAVYKLLGIHKLTTSAHHPSGNGGVERVSHTMAQMLAMVCNEHQNDWDVHLTHVEYAYNNSVSAATGLATNEVHTGRLPRPPLAVFDRSYGDAHQNLDRDQLTYCDLARERQQRAYQLVREQHTPSPLLG